VTVARTPDDWAVAIARALSPAAGRSEVVAARQQVAREHDWDDIVRGIARSIGEGLGTPYRERCAELPVSRGAGGSTDLP
jgi:hypothetical protein